MEQPLKKLLLIDDEPDFLTQLQELLGEYYSVQICSKASEGHAAISSFKPDCLMLDLNMPRFDGRVYLPWLRAEFPNLPIVICSGEDHISVDDFKEFGVHFVLRKPVTVVQIIQAVESSIKQFSFPSRRLKESL